MQLDFIGTIKPKREVKQIQYSLWNEDYSKPNKVKSEINYSNVEKFFNQLTAEEIAAQKTYWASVTPQDCGEKFQRWLFAFMSVHTSWQSNVKGYQAIKAWTEWFNKPDALKEKLISSTVGMHNNRTRYVDEFSKAYWNAPKTFNKQQGETWVQFRNRLVEQVLGLGMAKISFGLECVIRMRQRLSVWILTCFNSMDSTRLPIASTTKRLSVTGFKCAKCGTSLATLLAASIGTRSKAAPIHATGAIAWRINSA